MIDPNTLSTRLCGALFVILSLLPGASSQAASSSSKEKKPAAVVFTSAVKQSELFELLTFPALVQAKVNTTIYAESDGVVRSIASPLGAKVRRGQRILTIQHTDPVYQFAPVRVEAPVAGAVSGLEVTVGSSVRRGDRLASVTDPSQTKLTVEIPAQDLASLGDTRQGEFRVAGREESVPVRIRGLSPFVDPATGTATCELEIVPPAKGKGSAGANGSLGTRTLVPGLIGQVSFRANMRTGITVPDHAVHYRGGETFVKILESGKVKQLSVKLGRKQRGQVEILEGLRAGAELIERSSRFISDGESVEREKQGGAS